MYFSEPDPSYSFVKPLNKKTEGFTRHDTFMECTVSNSLAIVSWWRGDTKLTVNSVSNLAFLYSWYFIICFLDSLHPKISYISRFYKCLHRADWICSFDLLIVQIFWKRAILKLLNKNMPFEMFNWTYDQRQKSIFSEQQI